jgi:ATP-dependent DNA helicase RecQ
MTPPLAADLPAGLSAALAAALARLGFDGFRPGQEQAIETLLAVGRLLLVAPTGGGKSLTYQLPATLLPGTTLVVSPLISLMHDQVAALNARGVAASYLASTLPADELRARMAAMGRGEFRLVYVAPERLAFPGFRSLLADVRCPLVAIDEAHCISEWGHDFRPEYMQIGALLAELGPARVLACTATATPVVRDEILARLGLAPDTPQIVHGFARPNLALRVREIGHAREREPAVDESLAEALERPGAGRGMAIVYAPTRRSTEQEAARLVRARWRAAAYHAGMAGAERDAVQVAFAAGELEVVVATNAFGMGIDRPDVRLVVHLAPPGSIEAYYQEVGRAGRDGEPAIGQLLLAPGDLALRRSLMERDGDPDSEIARHKWNLFLELMRWAEGGSCRHDTILRYFGDEAETLSGCGRCDVCVGLADGESQDPAASSLIVRKALSGVARAHDRFGMGVVSKLLKGVGDERLHRSGLDAVSTFGVLAEHSEDWLLRLLRRCVTAGWIDFRGGDRPVVVLTDEGRLVMQGRREARLLLPAATRPGARDPGAAGGRKSRAARSRDRGAGAPSDEALLDEAESALFEALRRHRLELARQQAVPPFVVASDRTLRDLARRRPATLEELQLVHGIGPAKLQAYGQGLLAVVSGMATSGRRLPAVGPHADRACE